MDVVFKLHSLFGERILTTLIVLGIIYLAATWKADQKSPAIGRILAVLVDIQVAFGLALYVMAVTQGMAYPATVYLHAAMGVLASGVAHMAAKNPPFLAKMGRFSPVAGFGLALLLVLIAVFVGRSI
jgi:FtsH-binding integral membrane protein